MADKLSGYFRNIWRGKEVTLEDGQDDKTDGAEYWMAGLILQFDGEVLVLRANQVSAQVELCVICFLPEWVQLGSWRWLKVEEDN